MVGAPLGNPAPAAPTPAEPVPDVGLLRPVNAPAQTAPMPAQSLPEPLAAPESRPRTFPTGEDAMQADIQKILGSIKLPERRGATPAAKPEKQIPVAPIEEHLEKPAQQEPAQTGERPVVTPLHTLRDDIQHVVREDKMSLVRAASLEEDRKIREAEGPQTLGSKQRASRTRGILFASALLIFLGLAAIGGVALVAQQQNAPAAVPETTSLIFAEQNLILPIDGLSAMSIKAQIAQLRASQPGSLGSITRIIPTVTQATENGNVTRPATTREFFEALGLSAPDELLRALGPTFFFGMHSADKNAPVFVISVSAYDHAFAGMLAWESVMNGDLTPIFTPVPIYRTGTDNIPHERLFEDAVIRNYDTRTLTDDTGTIQLYYSFPSPSILVIAESPYTFAEVLNRLRAQRRL